MRSIPTTIALLSMMTIAGPAFAQEPPEQAAPVVLPPLPTTSTHGNAMPVWAPSPFVVSDERLVDVRLLTGFQDYVFPAENRFRGLGLLGKYPSILVADARVHLISKPWLIFSYVQFAGGLVIQYDQYLPAMMSVRLITKPIAGLSFAVEPVMLTGYDTQFVGTNLSAGRRSGRFFYSAGGQVGELFHLPHPIAVVAATGAVGVEVVPSWVSVSLEGGTSFTDCHRGMLNATLDLVHLRVSAGGGLASVGNELRPTFQLVLAGSFGKR